MTVGNGASAAPARSDAAPESFAADAITVFTLTISTVAFAIALAALIFGGALEPGMPRAVGSFVIGSGVLAITVALRTQIVPVATFVQDAPAILMAAVAADFIATDGVGISDVFVLLAVTTVATALATSLIGSFGLGGAGRYLPTSVVGAFVGGTGWLLFKGGLDVMTNSTIGLGDVNQLFDLDVAKFWVPGTAVALFAWRAGRSHRASGHTTGVIVCACLAGFYLAVALFSSISAVESAGWLLGPFPEGGGTPLVTPDEFRAANWSHIAKATPGILSVVGLSCVAQLFSLTGIRSELVPQLDINAELQTGACGNLTAALFGVTPGFQGLGYTALLHRLGSTRRAVPMISGGLVVVFGIVGVAAVGYVPRLIIGALLVLTGLTLFDAWRRGLTRCASRAEKLLNVSILFSVAWFGLLAGIGIGLVLAATAFIVRYSRVDPIRSISNGRQMRSRVDRSSHQINRLIAAGDRLAVVELQGYLFFGSLTTLEDRVAQVTSDSRTVDMLVIDFAHVTGVDTSGCTVLDRLFQEARHKDVAILVSAIEPGVRQILLTSDPELAINVTFTNSLDSALERAENRVLSSMAAQTLQPQLIRKQATLSSQLLSECEALRFEPGTVVMAQGAPTRGMLIVQRGRITAYRVEADNTRTRLRSFGELTVVGEVGLISGAPYVAEVVAEGVIDGWWLSTDRYQVLQNTKPWLIFELYEFIVRSQTERAISSNHSAVACPTSVSHNGDSLGINGRSGHGMVGHI